MRRMRVALVGCVVLALAGCGDYPQPFLGRPGAMAMRLRQPPDPRLAIPPPGAALLTDAAGQLLAADLAARLQRGEVPAYAQKAAPGDWRLAISAETSEGQVRPRFTVLNPQGQPQGAVAGRPVSEAAWAAADPAVLRQTATDAAPGIAALLTRIEAGIMRADPNSLFNRVARVAVPAVTGAPGDGDTVLARQMREKLAALGPTVAADTPDPDFTVQGQVRMVPIAGGQQRVEIQWIIKDARGREAGRVIQLNDIPTGTLDHYWGDVAVVVAKEASGGVNEVIERRSGKQAPPAS